jgi:hypothetical protein
MAKHKTGFARMRDKNEPPIIRALESVGASVERLNATGVPDLLVGFQKPSFTVDDDLRGVTRLMEVKRPLGKRGGASHATLTPDQQTWWNEWKGDMPVIVRSPEEALRALGLTILDSAPGIWTYCPRHNCDGRNVACEVAELHRVGTYPRGTK